MTAMRIAASLAGLGKTGPHLAVAIVAAFLALAAGDARALQINLFFSSSQTASAGNQRGSGNLVDISNRAASFWTGSLSSPDNYVFNIGIEFADFGNSSNTLGSSLNSSLTRAPSVVTTATLSSGGVIPLSSVITLNEDVPWFFDSSLPSLGSGDFGSGEWNNVTTPSTDYGAGAINRGRTYTGATGDASNAFDLFTVVAHEIGHSIGLRELAAEDFDSTSIVVSSPRPFAGSTLPTTSQGGGHLNIASALMFPSISRGVRKLPAGVDLLATAELAGYTVISQHVSGAQAMVPLPAGLPLALTAFAALGLAARRRAA